MSAQAGRQITFEWDGAEILGVREKGVTLNGDPIDTGSDEDDGWRQVLTDIAAEDKVDISISGVTKDNTLKNAWFSRERTAVVTITYKNGDIITGSFFLTSHDEKAPFKDAVTFDAKLVSTGPVTFTPA